MNRCPITYEVCLEDQKYTKKGLQLLSKSLIHLNDFPYTAEEQIQQAREYASKLSIQGIQPKLSVSLNLKKEEFEIVEKGGRYILKPPHNDFKEVPQNKDLSMRLAKAVGIEVPFHGMIYNIDGSLSYIIKRFDRLRSQKVAVEDFSQLLQFTRDEKYRSSMEQIVIVIEKHCTFPILEKIKLFRLMIFNFLIGNEDMHLKNFSLIRNENMVALSPAYDLLNTTIIMKVKEEIALSIQGKKNKLNRSDFVDYFGIERLGLSEKTILEEFLKFEKAQNLWTKLLTESFLSEPMRIRYQTLIQERWKRLNN